MMPTPFPGMDPFLEAPSIWRGVHTWLNIAMAEWLGERLRPRYIVDVEERIYVGTHPYKEQLVGIVDVGISESFYEPTPVVVATPSLTTRKNPLVARLPLPEKVKQRYLVVRDLASREMVTVIEVLSYANKRGEGRRQYLKKRLEILGSATHLIEIDLLRAGRPLPIFWEQEQDADYRVVVSRRQQRPYADVYLFSIQDRIPDIPVPLHTDDDDLFLPLNELIHTVYERANYDLKLDYALPLQPAVSAETQHWITQQLNSR